MTTASLSQPVAISKSRLWASRIMGGLVILFMSMDTVFKFIPNEEIVKGTTDLGFDTHHLPIIGMLALISTILYIYRRTEILGAILLTAYWGGAIATHVRLDNPLFSHILFAVYFGILAWGALWLKNEQLRNLIPVKK